MQRAVTITVVLALAALLIPPAGAQAGASIQIVSPRNNATVSGTQMVVEVRVKDFMLNPSAIGKPAKPGEGHWRVYVDGKLAGLSANEVVSVPNDTCPFLAAGKHTVKVELRNNDHTPVAGATGSEITLTIPPKSAMHYVPTSGQPGIKILVPHNHSAVSPYLIVWVKVRDFKENPVALGTAAKAGEGHWRLYVDGKLAGVSASNVTDVQLTRGKHTLKAGLYNNDRTVVRGALSDQVTVSVR
ncbi:MAG TPA: hypothetical protein VJT32_08295 [bacterium]|nr:hypothetical protein [bacterium]